MVNKETHKQYSLKLADEVVESLNKSVEAEQQMPKDILAEIFEKSDEEFLLSCYAVHKEFETKAGRQPQSLKEYTEWFYRERTEEELKEAERLQDEMDTYLRHNGSIGSRARTKPKLTFIAKVQKLFHKLFS